MTTETINFRVTHLNARAPEGVPVTWQGREFSSGPLHIELDPGQASAGQLDYAAAKARAEFRVKLSFPEFAESLRDLGVDPALTRPVDAVVRSEGPINADHSFSLSGAASLSDHAMFPRESTGASVLPGT